MKPKEDNLPEPPSDGIVTLFTVLIVLAIIAGFICLMLPNGGTLPFVGGLIISLVVSRSLFVRLGEISHWTKQSAIIANRSLVPQVVPEEPVQTGPVQPDQNAELTVKNEEPIQTKQNPPENQIDERKTIVLVVVIFVMALALVITLSSMLR